ncbi:hypothetical protein TBLA_0D03630 [Henningerozyma blattae CBS 6284]|uniref:Phosphatidyl-N-methylethanolamine N-methyltransferase n=1 Tax=Henningerozyma blattae (strain ATCC 34711 / CBS 6284 / DSM 70876 / NBRC 10599 / NRRL Y-10934 / UCD 77-7) TaxID=1071380 RepID=I2H3B0_HENB6|nr:hypothetical protein TBLA_0D03630 [Tetrapisispora blattae CBS 6284]CCH60862.1 hypothetical protein TBLA_0D03630 [Tetrapisispora blattae CBS 6284]
MSAVESIAESVTSAVNAAAETAASVAQTLISEVLNTATELGASPTKFDLTDFINEKLALWGEICMELVSSIDFENKLFMLACFCVCFNPMFWNIVARMEYKTHFLTKLAGSAKKGCYILAFIIFSLGIVRDIVYERALAAQPVSALLTGDYVKCAGYLSIGVGQVLVLTSMYQLGITGTYLGDYFGILMEERVTTFPFNVSNNPMYQGSTLSFLGAALVSGKPAGLLIAFLVSTMYQGALQLEEPFTAQIYAKRDQERSKKNI